MNQVFRHLQQTDYAGSSHEIRQAVQPPPAAKCRSVASHSFVPWAVERSHFVCKAIRGAINPRDIVIHTRPSMSEGKSEGKGGEGGGSGGSEGKSATPTRETARPRIDDGAGGDGGGDGKVPESPGSPVVPLSLAEAARRSGAPTFQEEDAAMRGDDVEVSSLSPRPFATQGNVCSAQCIPPRHRCVVGRCGVAALSDLAPTDALRARPVPLPQAAVATVAWPSANNDPPAPCVRALCCPRSWCSRCRAGAR